MPSKCASTNGETVGNKSTTCSSLVHSKNAKDRFTYYIYVAITRFVNGDKTILKNNICTRTKATKRCLCATSHFSAMRSIKMAKCPAKIRALTKLASTKSLPPFFSRARTATTWLVRWSITGVYKMPSEPTKIS